MLEYNGVLDDDHTIKPEIADDVMTFNWRERMIRTYLALLRDEMEAYEGEEEEG